MQRFQACRITNVTATRRRNADAVGREVAGSILTGYFKKGSSGSYLSWANAVIGLRF